MSETVHQPQTIENKEPEVLIVHLPTAVEATIKQFGFDRVFDLATIWSGVEVSLQLQ